MKRSLAYVTVLSVLVGAVVLGAFACGQSPVVWQTVGPEGAAITITEAMSKELAGTELIIPAGALTEKTNITIALGHAVAASDTTPIGPSIAIGPEGLVFQQSLTLLVPATQVQAPDAVAVSVTRGAFTMTVLNGRVIDLTSNARSYALPAPDGILDGPPVATLQGGRVAIQFQMASELQPVVIGQR